MHDDDVEGFEPVVSRLHAAAEQPVDPATARMVLDRARQPRVSWIHSTRLKVAAGIASGFLLGSAGLASAGALPAPAQRAAHAAFKAVGVQVPPGHERYDGPECGGAKNHGEYVRARPTDPEAGKSPCGKPYRAVNKSKGNGEPDVDEGEGNGRGRGTGKPEGRGNGEEQQNAPVAPAKAKAGTTTTTTAAPESTATTVAPTTSITSTEPTSTTTAS